MSDARDGSQHEANITRETVREASAVRRLLNESVVSETNVRKKRSLTHTSYYI